MKRCIERLTLALLCCGAIVSCSDQPSTNTETQRMATDSAPQTIPDWAQANIRYMSAGTGQWVADNSAYKSDNEPWDAYVIAWRAGPDDLSMTARMYALKDGQPSQGDFWSFYQFWDYATSEMRILQSGWGVHGDGTIWQDDDNTTLIAEQIFTAAANNPYAVRHDTVELSPTQHRSTSFNRSEAGDWVKDRSYVWVRTAERESEL